ncbi:MAG: TlpA disulfide reductase family protein [Isosphaeraceae bacterium]
MADSLVKLAIESNEYDTARKALDALIGRFPRSEIVGRKAPTARARLDLVGQSAPAPTLASDIQGKPLKLADYRGKYVLVDFWATFCAPWVGDLAKLQAAHAKFKDRGFEIVGVSLDETREEVVDYAKARKIAWRQVHSATSGDDLVAAFKVGALPSSFLIDPQGKVIRLDLRGGDLDAVLASLLDPARTTAKPAAAPARR